MATAERRPPLAIFIAGLILGLVVGAAGAMAVSRMGHADPWIDAGAVWLRLPARTPVGALPQTLAVPAKAYDYGAVTEPLSPLTMQEPSILRVGVEVRSGRVGLALVTPDGARLLSGERALTSKNGPVETYFRVGPALGPAILVLRNYDNEGTAGSAAISSVRYAPIRALSQTDLGVINRTGLK